MPSIFSKIIQGEIPSYTILEDEQFFAFLDISPVNEGHTLVVPKVEIDYIFDLEDEKLAAMMAFAKKVAHALKLSFECNRIGVTVIGLEVPHAHIHLIPIKQEADMSFSNPRKSFSPEQFKEIQTKIKANL